MRVALVVEINSAGDAAVAVHLNAMDVRVRTDFAASGFFRHADRRGERAGFCADFTAERQAEAAVDASAASRARLRKNGHRRGKRMPAKLPSRALENYAGGFYGKWRHRIRLGARRIKRAGAGESGNADFPFHFGVVRLEVGVSDGPVAQIGAGNGANLAALDEIDFVEAPEICGEMHAGAADAGAINNRPLRFGF